MGGNEACSPEFKWTHEQNRTTDFKWNFDYSKFKQVTVVMSSVECHAAKHVCMYIHRCILLEWNLRLGDWPGSNYSLYNILISPLPYYSEKHSECLKSNAWRLWGT